MYHMNDNMQLAPNEMSYNGFYPDYSVSRFYAKDPYEFTNQFYQQSEIERMQNTF